ncbi:MAG: hypothetical protein ACI9WU_002368 [Myxococcota bacterium]|jgi:hypothetical protein
MIIKSLTVLLATTLLGCTGSTSNVVDSELLSAQMPKFERECRYAPASSFQAWDCGAHRRLGAVSLGAGKTAQDAVGFWKTGGRLRPAEPLRRDETRAFPALEHAGRKYPMSISRLGLGDARKDIVQVVTVGVRQGELRSWACQIDARHSDQKLEDAIGWCGGALRMLIAGSN